MNLTRATDTDDHFKLFATGLQQGNLRKYGSVKEADLLELQRRQVEKLVDLELRLKTELISGSHGIPVYRAFIAYICEERKNILDARPYFRERQTLFTSEISGAFKNRSPQQLFKFHFNWQFIAFMLRVRNFGKRSPVMKLVEEIRQVRTEIVEMNLPLAISRARIFWSRTPKSHLTHMDLVQISCEGLMSGVDKFCLPFSRAFRGVCIGRMVGNFIERYSETLVHFFPVDKRKIYRANKVAGRLAQTWSDIDFEALAEQINTNVDEPIHRTDAGEIAGLMAAASCVSTDDSESASAAGGSEVNVRERSGLSRYAAPESARPDVSFERIELSRALASAIENLSIVERKILRMKGLDLASLSVG